MVNDYIIRTLADVYGETVDHFEEPDFDGTYSVHTEEGNSYLVVPTGNRTVVYEATTTGGVEKFTLQLPIYMK